MAVKFTIDEKVPFTVKLVDRLGNPIVVPVDLSVTNGTLLNVAPDGSSGEVAAVAVGVGQVQAKVGDLVIAGDFEVLAGGVASGTIEFGAPVRA